MQGSALNAVGTRCCGASPSTGAIIAHLECNDRHGSVPCMAIMVASAAATVTVPHLLPPCLLRVCVTANRETRLASGIITC